jgi:hypothetical protein
MSVAVGVGRETRRSAPGTSTWPVPAPAGATAVDGDSIWTASEWVAQTCTYADYNISGPGFGTCGGTRAPLGNWSTRISKLSTK